jgi:nitroreductase
MDQAAKLMRILLARRSCRAFSARRIPDGDLDRIETACGSLPTVRGRGSGRAFLVRDPDQAAGLVDALVSGLAGKANLWLARRIRPPAFVVCAGDPGRSPVNAGRHLYNIDAAMAGEAAVLEATALGIDSIWMAAIGERRVVSFLGLREGERVNALIALGYNRRGGIYHSLAQTVLSGRRRPLARIAHDGRFGVPLAVRPPDPTKRARMIELHGRPDEKVDIVLPAPAGGFRGRPTDEQLRLVLDAARWAPNADNAQLGRWIVMREPARIETLLEAAGVAEASKAGDHTILAACAAPVLMKHRSREQPFALIDIPIAIVHQIAMAAALELGWNMLVDFDYARAGEALGLPLDHACVALVMLGRPASGQPPSWQKMVW